MIAEAEKTGKPISAWFLAKRKAKSSNARNQLDGKFRYRLSKLVKQKLVITKTYRKGKKAFTEYRINPAASLCVDGSLVILTNPVTVLLCPHVETCPSHCHIDVYKQNGKLTIKGCELLKNAPENIKEQYYQALASMQTLENARLKATPTPLTS